MCNTVGPAQLLLRSTRLIRVFGPNALEKNLHENNNIIIIITIMVEGYKVVHSSSTISSSRGDEKFL